MRVVLIVPGFPKLSETFIVNKFIGLLNRGWDVYVVCDTSKKNQWENFPNLAAHPQARQRVKTAWPHRPLWLAALLLPLALVVCFWGNPAGAGRYLWRGWRRFGLGVLRQFYLDASILALAPGLVHFEFGSLAVGRMHLKQLLDCKAITSFRGYDLNLSGLDQPGFLREVWEQTDALHLLSAALWKRAQQRGCPPAKPHALIPPAIDAEFFQPDERVSDQGAPTRTVRILSVGRLTWEKGYDHALQAIRSLLDQGVDCEYRIVGDGSMFEALAFARHQLALSEKVHFLGALSPAQTREEMLRADIFLHSAVSEGFCNAVLEAQALELPVVSSDAGGLPENVVDGETGFVVPRRNASALADKLRLLAASPSFRAQMGQAGRARVLKHFRLQDQVEAFVRLYQQLS